MGAHYRVHVGVVLIVLAVHVGTNLQVRITEVGI